MRAYYRLPYVCAPSTQMPARAAAYRWWIAPACCWVGSQRQECGQNRWQCSHFHRPALQALPFCAETPGRNCQPHRRGMWAEWLGKQGAGAKTLSQTAGLLDALLDGAQRRLACCYGHSAQCTYLE
jgi:hypothetical protein